MMSSKDVAVVVLVGAMVLTGCSVSSPATHSTPEWAGLIEEVSAELESLQPSLSTEDVTVPGPDPVEPLPPVTTSSPNAVATDLANLEVGQCLLWPYDESLSLMEVAQVVPCNEPHYGEVYVVGAFSEADYPDDADAQVAAACETAFTSYVGIDYWSSVYYYDSSYPTESGWQSGSHAWRCYAIEADHENTGSIRGAGR
jgi:hypothetical protein